ncbi:MAG: helix-turn-helix transcriptional regulator [Thermoleophilia bacterium]
MTAYDFTLVLMGGPPDLLERHIEEFYDSGCDDALFGERDGVVYADFSRTAAGLAEAVGSAIRAVEGAVEGVTVARVEPDALVTIADIAERLRRSEEGVRLLIVGKRGPGGFPAPVARLGRRRSRLWRWTDVLAWMSVRHGGSAAPDRDACVIEATNAALALRRATACLETSEMREIAPLVGARA